jgi:hypothetical protein
MDTFLAKTHVWKDTGNNKCSTFRERKGGTMFDRLDDINVLHSFPVENMHVDSEMQLVSINFWKNPGYIAGSRIKKINGMIKKKIVTFQFRKAMRLFLSCEKFK